MSRPAVQLTDRYDAAVAWARELHAEQTRKGTTIPYLSHLLAVSARVLEDGGDEDQAIAGLLHDSIEDQGVTPDEIDARFGHRAGGFGSVRVEATIGATTWQTSIFPDTRRRTYVLPVKKAVRAAEGLADGSSADVTLVVLV